MAKLSKKNSIGKVFSGGYVIPSREESFLFETVPSFFYSWLRRPSEGSIDVSGWMGEYEPHTCNTSVSITWAGHATCIIHCGPITIVTDPIFHSLPLFSRQTKFGATVDVLPQADAILISHNHHDHMHMASLYTMQHRSPKVHIAVPEGDKKWLDPRVFSSIEEYVWGQQFTIEKEGNKVTCTFVPSHHWSRRSLFDRNISLWGSWVIQYNDQVFYFGGDSAYHTHFEEIGELYDIDVALLPIGPAEPHEHMKYSHLSPEQAGQAFLDLNAKQFIPIHWGTFAFGSDRFDEPVIRLQKWWKQNAHAVVGKELCCQKIGHNKKCS